MATGRLRQACPVGPVDAKPCDERVSNQPSNDRGEHRDMSADIGGQCEQATWSLPPGDGPTTWLRDEEATATAVIVVYERFTL